MLYESLEKRISSSQQLAIDQNPILLSSVANPIVAPQPVELEKESKMQSVQEVIDRYTKNSDVVSSVVVENLLTGEVASSNGQVTFVSASFYKLFVAYEVFALIDEGQLQLDAPTGFESGNTSVKNCLDIMISASDNDCGRSLRKLINADNLPLTQLADRGFISTNLSGTYPTTTAADVSSLYRKLFLQDGLTGNSNALFLEMLKAQQIDNRIPQAVEVGIEVAHKTADLEGYSHDGGIIYAPSGAFSLVIMGGPWPNGYDDAPSKMIELTREIYQEMEKINQTKNSPASEVI